MAESVVVIKKLLQLKVRLFTLHTTPKVVQFHTWINTGTLPSVKKPIFDFSHTTGSHAKPNHAKPNHAA